MATAVSGCLETCRKPKARGKVLSGELFYYPFLKDHEWTRVPATDSKALRSHASGSAFCTHKTVCGGCPVVVYRSQRRSSESPPAQALRAFGGRAFLLLSYCLLLHDALKIASLKLPRQKLENTRH